jgi:hypothetical protein
MTVAGLRFRADPVGGSWLFAEGERDGGADEPECLALPAGGFGEDGDGTARRSAGVPYDLRHAAASRSC